VSDPRRLVVVGASLAGLRTVEAARRLGFEGQIVLVGAERHAPYDRPPLSKAVLAAGGPSMPPTLRTSESLRDDLGVDLRLGTPATALHPGDGVLSVGLSAIRYDALVVATGATARTLPGTEGLSGVYTLRTVEDALAIRAALDAGARTVVVGAGFIGSEVASAACGRGLRVTVIEALEVPLSGAVGAEAGSILADLHRAAGVDLRLGVRVAAVRSERGRVCGVELATGEVVPAELLVVGAGAAPSTAWLVGSGVQLHDADGGVICDETLWTGIPAVFAAGDVAHWHNPLLARGAGDLMRLEHWTNAADHGAAAAAHALGLAPPAPVSTVPYFWSDWHGRRVQFVGTPDADEVIRIDSALDPATDRPLLLYRRGDRVVGALSVDRPSEIMKYRRLLANRATWSEASECARTLAVR